MNELLQNRKDYVRELMKIYENKSVEYLKDAQAVFDKEKGFIDYMKEKISVSSYQKGLDDFLEETKRIEDKIVKENKQFNDLLNDFALKDNEFSVSILSNTKKGIFDKIEVENNLKKLEDDFDTNYKTMIDGYTNELNELLVKIKKIVETNRKFVIEYGGLQLTDTPVKNEYKPIYDIHDQIYDKFIFEFQTMAYRINFLAEQIKSTYTRTIKLLDENYDIFSDLLKDLEKSNG